MTDLVTDTAINAALKARWQTGMEWLHGKDETPDTALRNQLEAAAPFIAAEALRQEIKRAEGDFYETWGYVDESADSVLEGLRQRADELEGK